MGEGREKEKVNSSEMVEEYTFLDKVRWHLAWAAMYGFYLLVWPIYALLHPVYTYKKVIKPFCAWLWKKCWFYLVVFGVFAIDQLSKLWVTSYVKKYGQIPVIKDVLHLVFVMNPGAAFGILPNKKWLFVGISLITIGLIMYYEKNIKSWWLKTALAFLMGGGLGNLYDRIKYGAVIDFIDVRFIDWPVFNLADVFIDIGVGMFIAEIIFGSEEDFDNILKEDDENGELS